MNKKTVYLIKNEVHRDPPVQQEQAVFEPGSLVALLQQNKKDIIEKKQGDISSFNFSKDVFNKRKWTELSKIARGLFIDNRTGKVIARAYEKFFNYKEGNFNRDDFLMSHLQFPVVAYKKYNGFLGILSVKDDELLFCTKSLTHGPYHDIFKAVFNEVFKKDEKELVEFLKNENSCMVFEVIDPVKDPHIVEYGKTALVLLDVVKLEEKFSCLSYDKLVTVGCQFGFPVKAVERTMQDWDHLKKFIDETDDYEATKGMEGYVIVDQANYHFKLKGRWYKFWKEMRGLKDKVASKHLYSTSGLTTPRHNDFHKFLKQFDPEELREKSIIDLRKEYLNNDKPQC